MRPNRCDVNFSVILPSRCMDSKKGDGIMKRILAIILAGVMGAVLLSTDVSAGGRKRHHFKRRGGHHRIYRGHEFYRPYFRRPGYYYRYRHGYRPFRPRVIFYNCYGCGGYYRRHQHYNHYHPAYRPSSTTVYSSGTTYSGGGGQLLGAILGGIGGGVIGHQIGGGSGKAVATVAGSVIGLLVGGEIGRQLDERGRLIMARTTSESLDDRSLHRDTQKTST